jgi:hypothetical protein
MKGCDDRKEATLEAHEDLSRSLTEISSPV